MPHKWVFGLDAGVGGAAAWWARPDEGGRVESRGGNSILPFSCGLPGGFAPGSSLAFWLGLASCLGGFAPGLIAGLFSAAPHYLDLGYDVGTDVVQPLV